MKPFREIELSNLFVNIMEKIQDKVDGFSNDEIMANDLDLLADNLYEQFYIEPVTIHEEDFSHRSVKQAKVTRYIEPFFRDIYGKDHVEVDGYCMSFQYSFTGDSTLFKCQGSTFSCSPYPNFTLSGNNLILRYEKTIDEMKQENAKDNLERAVERDVEDIKRGIQYVNNDVVKFNASLREQCLTLLRQRKEKVEAFYSVASLLEVPISRSTYASTHIPVKRKILPIAHKYNHETGYCISETDYSDILEAIKHTGSTYERTPSSYKSMHEEDLRNTLLATLNATYLGDATGETFRNHGKTDICIERGNRAAFVAECKIWTGQKEVQNALEQLDSYLTWRDCKTALIYFVRRKDFLSVLETAEKTIKGLSSVRQLEKKDKNIFKCCMASTSNPGQLVHVHVMLFNLYA